MKIFAFADEAAPSLEGQIKALKQHKLNGLQIRFTEWGNVSDLSIAQARQILRRLKEEGLSVWSIGSPIGKIGIDDEGYSQHYDRFLHTLEVANALECNNMRMFSFYIPEGMPHSNYTNKVTDRLSRMAEAAECAEVALCHENEKGIYGDVASRCLELLKSVPALKCVFDPANFIQCGQDIPSAWQLLEKHVYYMHIKDALPSGQVVPAGQGAGHLEEILRCFVKGGGECLTIEPHLSVFDGLDSLQAGKKTAISPYTYPSREAAFAAASDALGQLLRTL